MVFEEIFGEKVRGCAIAILIRARDPPERIFQKGRQKTHFEFFDAPATVRQPRTVKGLARYQVRVSLLLRTSVL